MAEPLPHSMPPKVFRVRSYEPRDHAAVVHIFVEAIRQYPENHDAIQPHWQMLIDMSIKGDLADIDGVYFSTGGHYWVATCEREDGTGEELVGMVAILVEANGQDAELKRMAVHPSYHRCGIGRLLVKTLEAWATGKGLKRVWLGTGKPVVDAQRFYESLGYTSFATRLVAPEVEILLYEKRLAYT